MPFIIPFFNELLYDQLIYFGNGRIDKPGLLLICLLQWFGQDHIAKTDRRGNGFGKCAQVYDFLTGIIPFEGRNRLSFVPELAVIVIFHDIPSLCLAGPFKQFHPAADGHDDSGRILMGRRHIGNVGA